MMGCEQDRQRPRQYGLITGHSAVLHRYSVIADVCYGPREHSWRAVGSK